jgi:hypothetical protein
VVSPDTCGREIADTGMRDLPEAKNGRWPIDVTISTCHLVKGVWIARAAIGCGLQHLGIVSVVLQPKGKKA